MDRISDGLETKAGAGSDIAALFAEFSSAFEEFKRTNDQRLGEIEKRGTADGLLEGKLERLNAVLDGHKAAMDRASAERSRPVLEGKGALAEGEYKAAFSDYVKRGEEKALQNGVSADGGYVVPGEVETEITRLMTHISPIRAIAGVRQISASVYKRPITVTGPETGWVGETTARTETDSEIIAELSYPTAELYAMPAATSAFLDDAAVDVGQWIADEVNAAFAAQETTAFVTGNGARGGPERRTDVVTLAGGGEQRNGRWAQSRRRYNAGYGVKSRADMQAVLAFFEERRGRLHGFLWRDGIDHSSGGKVPAPTDQVIGVGDGERTQFQLTKTYGAAFDPYVRVIARPVAGSVRVAVDRVEATSGWSVDVTTGIVGFAEAPEEGAEVTAGFLFDVPVRFDTDRLDIE